MTTIISKGSYVGLTLLLQQKKSGNKIQYVVVLDYIKYGRWDEMDKIGIATKDWLFNSPSEAMSKFQQIRNQVKGLDKFKDLDIGKDS